MSGVVSSLTSGVPRASYQVYPCGSQGVPPWYQVYPQYWCRGRVFGVPPVLCKSQYTVPPSIGVPPMVSGVSPMVSGVPPPSQYWCRLPVSAEVYPPSGIRCTPPVKKGVPHPPSIGVGSNSSEICLFACSPHYLNLSTHI